MEKKSNTACTKRDKNEGFHKSCESEVETKYTHGGYNFGIKKPRGRGWKDEGVVRFNELFEKVKLDRAQNPTFNRQFVAAEHLHFAKTRKAPKRKLGNEVKVIKHELWDDDSDEGDKSGEDADGSIGNASDNYGFGPGSDDENDPSGIGHGIEQHPV